MSSFDDDLQLQVATGSSGPQTYTVAPTADQILRVYGVSWTIVDAYIPATSAGSSLGLPYNKFGALTALTNGVLVRRIQDEGVLFTNVVHTHADIISGPGGRIEEMWDDGTNVYLKTYKMALTCT